MRSKLIVLLLIAATFAYLNNPAIVAFAIDNVKPTREDIQNGSWPIAAPGSLAAKGQSNELEKAFLDYVLSASFKNSPEFARLGFVPLTK